MRRNTKIIATIGPACRDEINLRRLVDVGMNVARLNFSHGSHEQHAEVIRNIRKISSEYKTPITILQDLQGPKLRVGILPDNGIDLIVNQKVILASIHETDTSSFKKDDFTFIPFDVPNLTKSVQPGNRILLDDGNVELIVLDIGVKYITAQVIMGGKLTSHKGVNLPGAPTFFSNFTEKDRQDLEFGLQQGVDAIAISFVHDAKDICFVRDLIKEIAPARAKIPIIAKLERPEAIHNLDEILRVSDGVMVARGDLAVETSPAQVPVMQKKIIQSAHTCQKISITATQMLESMIYNPRPTRAEASDVANAIFDGTDAIMLSAETAAGQFPFDTVKMMDAIVCEAEDHLGEWGRCSNLPEGQSVDDAISLTRAARELAHDRDVARIAVFTVSGRTAQLMSKARPQVPIIAFTPSPDTYQWLNLLWGVKPILVPFAQSVEEMLVHVEKAMLEIEELHTGQQVVIICGYPVGLECPPNLALLHTLR
jgi:pyruvate kinase